MSKRHYYRDFYLEDLYITYYGKDKYNEMLKRYNLTTQWKWCNYSKFNKAIYKYVKNYERKNFY